jgi:hypothetical protein
MFAGCTSLVNVTLPNSLIWIENYVFDGCSHLTNIVIPEGVTTIMQFAFANCTSLTSINLPNSATEIAAEAFMNCSSVTNITLPDNITTIRDATFSGCSSLASIVIPASVTSIGDYVFTYCTKLTGIYFSGNAPGAGAEPFYLDPVIAYYLPGTTGWDSTFAGVPTALWLPAMQTSDGSFGVQTNQFGFNIIWASGQTVVVDACTNLSNPDWQPVQTNSLTTGTAYFSDPQWTNYPNRFYRLRSP